MRTCEKLTDLDQLGTFNRNIKNSLESLELSGLNSGVFYSEM